MDGLYNGLDFHLKILMSTQMNKKNEKTFEDALQRLEEIAQLLENEETPLEDSIQLFEEGIELKDFCEEKLKSAKLKINKIIKKNKDLVIEDFE